MEEQIRAAQASNDIATLLRLIAGTSELTVDDYVKKTVGSLLFLYYLFVERFNVRPKDMEDLVDGLLYLKASNYQMKKEMQKWTQNENRKANI